MQWFNSSHKRQTSSWTDEHKQLLQKRGIMRKQLAASVWAREYTNKELFAFWKLLANLRSATKQLKKARKKAINDMKAVLAEEIWEAWQARDMALVWKLARRMAHVGLVVGPKKRIYNTPGRWHPTRKEYGTLMMTPANEGGMSAKAVR